MKISKIPQFKMEHGTQTAQIYVWQQPQAKKEKYEWNQNLNGISYDTELNEKQN